MAFDTMCDGYDEHATGTNQFDSESSDPRDNKGSPNVR